MVPSWLSVMCNPHRDSSSCKPPQKQTTSSAPGAAVTCDPEKKKSASCCRMLWCLTNSHLQVCWCLHVQPHLRSKAAGRRKLPICAAAVAACPETSKAVDGDPSQRCAARLLAKHARTPANRLAHRKCQSICCLHDVLGVLGCRGWKQRCELCKHSCLCGHPCLEGRSWLGCKQRGRVGHDAP